MNDVWEEVAGWALRGDRGEIAGGVSGGCVEGAVVAIAERVIESGRPELVRFGIAASEA